MIDNCLVCINCRRLLEKTENGDYIGCLGCAIPGMVPKLVWTEDDYCPAFYKVGSDIK